ncbi:hypothetical protein FIN92_05610 [Prevotella brunnea]|uniref:hypothetical protein n=1 Tax=Prevotella brunnea TaxID=2508867 RepID=UPI0028054768|nr:hypothetical protein [Prevotella brunnea]MDR0186058.1 hypothetical protein [Prevotella brunnea]
MEKAKVLTIVHILFSIVPLICFRASVFRLRLSFILQPLIVPILKAYLLHCNSLPFACQKLTFWSAKAKLLNCNYYHPDYQ